MKLKNKISAQAARLKKIRLYLAMTREQFGDAIGISQYTIRSWENGEKNLTAEGVQRITDALKKKINFSCSFDWLMHGTGSSPITLSEEKTFRDNNEIQFDSVHEKILKEVITFKQLNPSATTLVVSSDLFIPLAEIGDYLGFLPVDPLNLDNFLGKILYTYSKDDISNFGILNKDTHSYHLTHFSDHSISPLDIKNTAKFYQLIWLRKIS